jgi:hypothetical protein
MRSVKAAIVPPSGLLLSDSALPDDLIRCAGFSEDRLSKFGNSVGESKNVVRKFQDVSKSRSGDVLQRNIFAGFATVMTLLHRKNDNYA